MIERASLRLVRFALPLVVVSAAACGSKSSGGGPDASAGPDGTLPIDAFVLHINDADPNAPDANPHTPDAGPAPLDGSPDAQAVFDTIFDATPPALTNIAMFRFKFHSTPMATFSCQYDQRDPFSCDSPTPIDAADGAHTFTVTATSSSGQVDPTPAMVSWTVDTKAPNTVLVVGPPATDSSATAHFEFSSIDTTATFLCAIDGSTTAGCTSPWDQPVANGPHTATITAIDPAGNKDQTPLILSWTTSAQ